MSKTYRKLTISLTLFGISKPCNIHVSRGMKAPTRVRGRSFFFRTLVSFFFRAAVVFFRGALDFLQGCRDLARSCVYTFRVQFL